MNKHTETLAAETAKLIDQQQYGAAAKVCRELNFNSPSFAYGWYLASLIMAKLVGPEKARDAISEAIRLSPNSAHYYADLALYQWHLSDDNAERAAREKALSLSTGDLKGLSHLADYYMKTKAYGEAEKTYLQLLELKPNKARYFYSLGAVRRYLGNFDGAGEAWSKCFSLDDSEVEALAGLSDLSKATPENNHLELYQKALNNPKLKPADKIKLHYAAAKELEDLEQWDKSFHNLECGSKLRKSGLSYKIERDLAVFNALVKTFDHSFMNQPFTTKTNKSINKLENNSTEDSPIFIVSLPRSGSTLVERIISSHSSVNSLGELENFSRAIMSRLKEERIDYRSRDEMVRASAALNMADLGETYISSVSHLKPMPLFIDKMPLNFLYCGLIAKALPNAKIIHVNRDPIDVCYAMYKKLFDAAYPMSYDQDDLAQYYIAYRQLMDHWQSLLGDRMYNVHYESLLKNQEQETSQLLAHLGLPFEQSCLHFELNTEASTTASASQVRQKLYTSSVKKWQRYQKHLAPLINQLSAAGYC